MTPFPQQIRHTIPRRLPTLAAVSVLIAGCAVVEPMPPPARAAYYQPGCCTIYREYPPAQPYYIGPPLFFGFYGHAHGGRHWRHR